MLSASLREKLKAVRVLFERFFVRPMTVHNGPMVSNVTPPSPNDEKSSPTLLLSFSCSVKFNIVTALKNSER
jgi:hypothetical protein